MIAAWMAYAIAVSLIFGLAGMALEQSLRLARRPARWGVAAAVLGSILVPAIAREAPASQPETLVKTVLADSFATAAHGLQTLPTSLDLGALDLPLIGFWIAGAFLTLGLVIGTQLRVLKDARECTEDVVHGAPVRRTRSFGPATVGCLKSFIVLPEWADRLDAESVRLMVLHEREHLRGRDPQLLFAALVLAALQPWNLALWWQLRRLRNAIELDCDQRVLARGADVRAYGCLLLQLASKRTPARLAALALSNRRVFVGRRIATMADQLSGSKHVRAAIAAIIATGLVVVGCETPKPVAGRDTVQSVTVEEEMPLKSDSDVLERHGINAEALVEYRVTAERIDEVLEYLREQGVRRAISDSGEVRVNLAPILSHLREEGVLRASPPSADPPLSFLFETRDGAPLGLIRLYEEEGERRVLLFKTIPLPGGD